MAEQPKPLDTKEFASAVACSLTPRVIFLPVVQRELRVASRKRSTFWVRITATVVALIFGSGFLVIVQAAGAGVTTPSIGKYLFGSLTWLSLGAALFAGVFFTSDCLSEEKREGTLGFLFLTDLRGYDVVLGKLLATSLRGFYTFLAVLPVLAITLLMGGVTGAEFWRVCVALVSALFFSLAAGMFVSTLSHAPQTAMGGTFVLLVVACALGPAADALVNSITPLAALTSPVYLFLSAGWSGQSHFGEALLLNQIIAWIFLALSCALLPRTWQVKATAASAKAEKWSRSWRFGSLKRRERLRAKLLGANPVLWLACRERWQGTALWILALLAVGLLAAMLGTDQRTSWFGWSYFMGAISFILYLAVAADSGRFFVNAQRSGLTELLLATPLTVRDIVLGHWRGLLRVVLPPIAICLIVQFVGTTVAQQKTYAQFAAMTATTPAVTPTNTTNAIVVGRATTATTVLAPAAVSGGPLSFQRLMPFLSAALASLAMLANLAALCWFGMWMGMTSKNSNLATLKTFLFVQVLPWFVIAFGSALIVSLLMMPQLMLSSGASSQWFLWYPLISAAVTTALYVAKDAAFIIWSRRKLFSDFRLRATRTVLPIQPILPPKILPPTGSARS